MNSRFLFLGLLACCFGCGTRISGKLVDSSGKVLETSGAMVNVSDLSGEIASQVLRVEKDGSFETQASLKPGEYYVEVLAPGYAINALRVKIEASKKIIFKMKPAKSAALNNFRLRKESHSSIYSRAKGSVTLSPPSL